MTVVACGGQVRVANLWSGGLDLESDWLSMRVCDPEMLLNELCKWLWNNGHDVSTRECHER